MDEMMAAGPLSESTLSYARKEDVQTVGGVCPICMIEIEEALDPETTNCGHVFCGKCLERALVERPVCPVCRSPQEVDTASDSSPTPSQEASFSPSGRGPRSLSRRLRDFVAEEKRVWRAALGGRTARD